MTYDAAKLLINLQARPINNRCILAKMAKYYVKKGTNGYGAQS